MTKGARAEAETKRVLSLLERQRVALLHGRFDELGRLAEELDQVSDTIAGMDAPDDAQVNALLLRLKEKSESALRLIQASRRGLVAARRIAEEASELRRTIKTYNDRGIPVDISMPRSGNDRRT